VFIEGLYFGEGPRWRDGKLWFSDFFDQAVKSVDSKGEVEVMVELTDRPSGLGWLPDGHLLIVAMRTRRVLRMEAEGLVEHADLSGMASEMLNDMVVDAAGRAYVGNFGFDLDHAMHTRGVEAVLANHPTAVLARVDPDGSVHTAATGLHFPNGSAITRDGKMLVVAETLALRLTAFDVAADGGLSNQRVWAPVGMRAPDGICMDRNGHVWIANAIGPECVLIAPGGEVVATVETDQSCFACALGGDDGKTLYLLTAPSSMGDVARASRQGRVLCARIETPGEVDL